MDAEGNDMGEGSVAKVAGFGYLFKRQLSKLQSS
jgi:hypothetical protein